MKAIATIVSLAHQLSLSKGTFRVGHAPEGFKASNGFLKACEGEKLCSALPFETLLQERGLVCWAGCGLGVVEGGR